ncbi:Hypothetical predicted protein [Prunus dulcis]|uniref:GDSL-like Lipase/Acylhydrolase superfamily protein n=1 Tax=Prunus dulcis TaxID=3755 RepID=A0A5E4EBZ8_PRUDU|nr:Hypothetical predicted protein [Prunus dulcis]
MDRMRFITISRWWRGAWGLKKRVEAVAVGVVLVGALSVFLGLGTQDKSSSACQFPAIYNFGDSNSDTGGLSATFFRLPTPYGNTFFGKPVGRFSDGRLIIDFIAHKLGLPFLSAYLDSLGSNFHHGASFATGGSTFQPLDGRMFEARYSPISLNLQLSQFAQFKARVNEVFTEDKRTSLPRPRDFSKALYTLDIGQNDLHAGLRLKTMDEVLASISNITAQLALTIEVMISSCPFFLSCNRFWQPKRPLGCLPSTLAYKLPKPDDLDQNGCWKPHNEVAEEFNRQIKDRVFKGPTFRGSSYLSRSLYCKVHTYQRSREACPLAQCCGSYGDSGVHCGIKTIVNGTEVEALCSNPSKYISWDGVHYSDAANQWLADRIMDGAFSDPPVSITEACHKPPHF